jgi:hypothetical protein
VQLLGRYAYGSSDNYPGRCLPTYLVGRQKTFPVVSAKEHEGVSTAGGHGPPLALWHRSTVPKLPHMSGGTEGGVEQMVDIRGFNPGKAEDSSN